LAAFDASFTEYRHNDTIVKETRTAACSVCPFAVPTNRVCGDPA
jgi:hypothetical protein